MRYFSEFSGRKSYNYRKFMEGSGQIVSKVLTLELNDDVYMALQQEAIAVGVSVADLVAAALNRQYSLSVSDQSNLEEAHRRLLSYAGVISLGYATGTDNESIDADLAKAYDNDLIVFMKND